MYFLLYSTTPLCECLLYSRSVAKFAFFSFSLRALLFLEEKKERIFSMLAKIILHTHTYILLLKQLLHIIIHILQKESKFTFSVRV